MPKIPQPLSESEVRTAKHGKKKRLFDGQGMFLVLTPEGSKLWRLRYHFQGRRTMMSLGRYPETSLQAARERRAEALKLIAAGKNPAAVAKERKALDVSRGENTFVKVAERYLTTRHDLGESSHKTARQVFTRNVYPYIGEAPIQDLGRDDIRRVLQKIVDRGAIRQAHIVAMWLSQVFTYADDLGLVTGNPVPPIKRTLPPVVTEHYRAVLDPEHLGQVIRAFEGYRGSPIVKAALNLLPLLACRPGELRKMEWAGINLDTAEWRYEVTKVKRLHIVPLPRQAVEILRGLQTDSGKWVFPGIGRNGRPLGESAFHGAFRALGIDKDTLTAHGFRATLRTIGEEVLGFRADLLEKHLSHEVKNPLGRAYSRVEFLTERREMLQAWADYLDSLKASTGSRKATA